jgi:aryl-alcohol dehydrogenase-like predicted oxidoreductase
MMRVCLDQGIGVIPWSPLARGRLSRPWDQRGETKRAATDEFGKKLYKATEDADHRVVDRVADVAAKRGVSMSQIALAWHFSKPYITAPIIGATKPHHLDDALAAVELVLTAEEVAVLEAAYEPHSVIGF